MGDKSPQMIEPKEGKSGMSCPRCGGMSAAELATAMNELVCDKAVIEGPHCHCDEVDSPMEACPLREQNATPEALPDENATSER
jgi:hypothetical protein